MELFNQQTNFSPLVGTMDVLYSMSKDMYTFSNRSQLRNALFKSI